MELSIWEIGNGQVPLPSRIVPTQVQCRGQPGVELSRLSMFPSLCLAKDIFSSPLVR
jgi:hypothetical protein